MRRLGAVLAAVALLAVGCDTGARQAAPFEGIWESEGWGTFLLIEGGDVEVYEHTDSHCLSVAAGGARGIADVLSFEGERLLMRDSNREVRFDPIERLPAACAVPADPAQALPVLAATVAEHYVSGVDAGWEQRRFEAIATAAGAGDTALLTAMIGLVGPLGGVRIAAGDGVVWPAPQRLDPPAGIEVRSGMGWGVLGETGYIGLERLGPFAADNEGSERVLTDALDEVLRRDRVIVDLRHAEGGLLGHALLFATRFVATAGPVASLEARHGDGFVPAGELRVAPLSIGTYPGTVLVLIGPATAGVAEILALALAEVDGVTLLGSPSAGLPGPPLVRQLPNGWSAAVPNLRVRGPGGELVGSVTPDVVSADPLGEALGSG